MLILYMSFIFKIIGQLIKGIQNTSCTTGRGFLPVKYFQIRSMDAWRGL